MTKYEYAIEIGTAGGNPIYATLQENEYKKWLYEAGRKAKGVKVIKKIKGGKEK